MNQIILVYITNPTEEVAEKVAQTLLKKRLVACANIFPSKSIYKWEGKLQKEKEYILIAKTLESKFDAVKEKVKKIHPYSVPCIFKLKAEANEEYFEWVKSEVGK